MYSEDDFIQLSAIQHFVFCQRQCALIHVERVWIENMFTAEGRVMHDKAHEERAEKRKDAIIERGMSIKSYKLGLSGKSDVVEFYKDKNGVERVFPIEYKRGKPKNGNCDKIQLCAQALCVEEMTGLFVATGAIFYGKTRRRLDVSFDEILRRETISAVRELRSFLDLAETPKAVYGKKCEMCSLVDICMPKIVEYGLSVEYYLKKEIGEL